MDFSFVNNKPATKRTEPVSDIPATSQQAAGASQPGSRQSAPAASSTTTNRPVIQLPSLPEVQAAQRPRAPPNLFRPAAATQPPTAPGNASSASASAAPTQRPAALPAATFSLSPAATLRAAQPQQPSSSANSAIQAAAFQQVNPNAILVNNRQEGNPLLRHIRNVRWQYADIVPDYQLGNSTCALFLSLRFHLLKPEYIHHRIRELQRSFRLRVLLCHVDVEDVVRPLEQVTKAALLNDCTLICAWSPEECARYLETYKAYETKPADSIQGRTDEDYFSRLNAAFTTVRGVNKTDVLTLASTFKSAGGIMQASMEELAACPGIGPTKGTL
ncbi:hypothetical protein WJX72_006617 [[Myrmecia] bisecta]|uniref:ERCC1-like central domain-containing protein n=1 Tax=[Myrmecia] bisecta TaxID=41462 RepID=A0AAW1QFL7_9CHLO